MPARLMANAPRAALARAVPAATRAALETMPTVDSSAIARYKGKAEPGQRRIEHRERLTGTFYAFGVISLLSSARIGISSKSSALRRVQSTPVGAAPGRLTRMVWVGVAITLSG